MDQDSFRLLLQTQKPDGSQRGSLLSIAVKPKTVDASQPAFKPRKVKKASESKYRDRAAERRQGEGNDYAQVEAVLEEFEKQHANADKEEVEEKRKYLGGDSDHSILIKGLDMALLQANRAKAAATSTEDDDTLEKAFAGEASASAAPKKKTREELLRELKEKRGQGQDTDDPPPLKTVEEDTRVLEGAKKAGKFKPIGFKPIAEDKPKKKKTRSDIKEGERKKKKRKLEEKNGEEISMATEDVGKPAWPPVADGLPVKPGDQPTTSAAIIKGPDPELSDDFNIFGDVGEYQGLDLDDEEKEEDDAIISARKGKTFEEGPSTVVPHRWVPMDEDDLPMLSANQHPLPTKSHSPPPHRESRSPTREAAPPASEEGEEKPVHLEPLSSSALPSIKDFLAMQEAAEAEEKRRKRKEKKKVKANK